MLTTAVYDIESAVSPFANFVTILDVTPPGQHASIIIPTASSLGKEKIIAIKNAIIGRIIIWLIMPIINALGTLKTFLKSAIVNPRPNVNIIKINDRGNKISIIIFNYKDDRISKAWVLVWTLSYTLAMYPLESIIYVILLIPIYSLPINFFNPQTP